MYTSLDGQTEVLAVGKLEEISDGGDGGLAGEEGLGGLKNVLVAILIKKKGQ